MEGIMEGREWIWDNGIIKEAEVAEMKQRIDVKSRQKQANIAALEFANFLKKL